MEKFNRDLEFILFRYDHMGFNTLNLGDQIQTLAVKNAFSKIGLKGEFLYYDRDSLSTYAGKRAVCVMQGFFDTPNFVPNENIIPVFVGFHLSMVGKIRRVFRESYVVDKFKSFRAIGCRDRMTAMFLKEKGIDSAYFSRCLTLTFDKRSCAPENGKVYIVGCSEKIKKHIPHHFLKDAEEINQQTVSMKGLLHQYLKAEEMAQDLLDTYREKAKLVITTALHVASPCLAMGIPVVLINPNSRYWYYNDRFDTLDDLLPLYTMNDLVKGDINWDPVAPDIEELKGNIIKNLKLSIEEAVQDRDIPELNIIRKGILLDKTEQITETASRNMSQGEKLKNYVRSKFPRLKALYRALKYAN